MAAQVLTTEELKVLDALGDAWERVIAGDAPFKACIEACAAIDLDKAQAKLLLRCYHAMAAGLQVPDIQLASNLERTLSDPNLDADTRELLVKLFDEVTE